MWTLAKWLETLKISWSNYLTYRLNFFLQVIGPGAVFLFIKYNLWTSIYTVHKLPTINGYSLNEMIHYHIWTMIVALFAQGHYGMNISEDIRLGKISSYLIYPFNFWEFHTASFLGVLSVHFLITVFSLGLFSLTHLLEFPPILFILKGFYCTLLVAFFWFFLQFLTGLLAFWLEETWVPRVTLQIITQFLSGGVLPLEFFPPTLKTLLTYTPFPFLTYYPTRIFLGKEGNILNPTISLSFWLLFILFFNTIAWKKGLKLYTAAGM